jgi:hypothetical protein
MAGGSSGPNRAGGASVTIIAGAYGLRLSGAEPGWLAVDGGAHWPELCCVHESAADAPELTLDLQAGELRVRSDVSDTELIHPLLGRVGAHMSLARGYDAMHAGAVAGSAGAWIVVGPKHAGKSTLLAGLADAGTPIVTDDVLVFGAGTALAGPRCIDLRPDVKRFGSGRSVRPGDPRNRISLPPIAAEHPLAGVIHLEWSASETAIDPLHHHDALARLLTVRSEKGWPRDPRALLELAALPTLRLRRPRSMSAFDDSVSVARSFVLDSTSRGTTSVATPSLVAA